MSNLYDYTVGWICAISTEYVARPSFLDEHEGPETISSHDNNDYTLEKVESHNVGCCLAAFPVAACRDEHNPRAP
ncbi:hypothetical protein BGW36DRAFT_377273 [Talaromyces proteolyticus]|uniref:Uncharacterized protein n=1 Tax=Talaromyces proteolyticus TaxID=1131652 RepID=A0AAD4KXJ9_9EURO|nr:uncharacterized protein BGW36DRAFT_377273 [Talaromyces proteolyticus]KAH8699093.1 hypothetical protein BGW36DRAFT_377273 [Talaromyces proteolyticus]